MNEELIISGRNLPNIDPHLNVWHWPIALDLFMGGLAAGILFFTAWYVIADKPMSKGMKWSTLLAPFGLVVALICLFIDLKHKLYFWRLYTSFYIESPMSFGSWVLLFITPLSFLWAGSWLRDLIPGWDWKLGFLNKIEKWVIEYRKSIAWAILFLAVGLGMYTGILLSAFNARPLWNTSLLGPLFLAYGLMTGAATIMWFSKEKKEHHLFTKITLALTIIVLFLIIHMFMGYLAGPATQVEAVELFLGGAFTIRFWVFVVLLGLIIPAFLEILDLWGVKIPATIPVLCILIGGYIFRMVMVDAGQLTRYLY
jgi:formate-dependent nitrite reductase membrane component NrfD